VVAAFATVYLIWGSTYLAIRLAIDTIPPLAMAGLRFLVAGAVLFPIAYLSGDRRGDRITGVHWRSAAVIGGCLLVGGNGGVTFAEEHVPSGTVALLVGSVPLWMAVFAHLRGHQTMSGRGVAGLVAGFAGVALLVGGAGIIASPAWYAVALAAPISWAAGSIYARAAPVPRRALLGVAMEMLCAGVALCAVAAIAGEWGQLHPAAVSLTSVLAFAWLVVGGSLVAYTAYVFLLHSVSPRAVSSYAYVNPLVAVVLGSVFLSEPLTPTTLAAAGLIVVAVAVMLSAGRGRGEPVSAAAGAEAAEVLGTGEVGTREMEPSSAA
jgi:drug/metabolite transporter (DMT)-like permease